MKTHIRQTLAMAVLAASLPLATAVGQTALPSSFGLAASSVDTSKKGFLVRAWKTDAGNPNDNDWTEDQLAGLKGPNTADTSAFTDNVFGNSYLDETGVINYWDNGGEGNFPNNGAQNVPGGGGDNYSLEIFTILDLPAGTLTMGVNSDDGFRLAALQSADPRERLASASRFAWASTTAGAARGTPRSKLMYPRPVFIRSDSSMKKAAAIRPLNGFP